MQPLHFLTQRLSIMENPPMLFQEPLMFRSQTLMISLELGTISLKCCGFNLKAVIGRLERRVIVQ